jgi:hypothetical protein
LNTSAERVPERPPLWTWAAAIVLACVLLGGGHLLVGRESRAITANELNLARIGALPANTPYVVILGTSKAGCAVQFDTDMTALVRARGVRASILRVAKSRAVVSDFDDVFAAMSRRPPKLVLIEEDLLVYEPNMYRDADEPARIGWRERMRKGMKALAQPHIDVLAGPYEFTHPQSASRSCPQRGWDRAEYLSRFKDRRVSTPAEQQALLGMVHALQAKGVAVALLDVPRSPEGRQLFPRRLDIAAQQIVDRAVGADGLLRLGLPPSIPSAGFCDPGHMNAQGRAIFSAWLAGRIASFLEAPSRG